MENNEFENQTVIDANDAPVGNDKLFAILAYIGILWILGLVVAPEKDHAFVKNHVNNGILISIGAVILGVIPFLGWALEIVLIVFIVMGIIAAVKGEKFTLPVVGDKITIIK